MRSIQFFRRFGVLTIVAIYILIAIGGVVRASGSGMGCPDWPKCFGMWVPPTSVDQLPVNYQEVFGAKLKGEVEFNVYKTWTEYLNRLAGVLIGVFIIISFVASIFAYFRKDKLIVLCTFLSFFLVLVEGWLGSKVVSTELHPVLITVHMLLSLIIVFLLIFAVTRSFSYQDVEFSGSKRQLNFVIVLTIILTLGQILFGTQLRESIDIISKSLGFNNRSLWFENLGAKVYFHVGLGIIVLLLNFLFYNLISKSKVSNSLILSWSRYALVLCLIAFFSGAFLGILKMPAYLQPVHLLMSTLVLGVQGVLYMILNPEAVNK